LNLDVFCNFVVFGGHPGAYDEEQAAARAYDLAALKYWGPDTLLNFPVPHVFPFIFLNKYFLFFFIYWL
jgi:hypothetical protein